MRLKFVQFFTCGTAFIATCALANVTLAHSGHAVEVVSEQSHLHYVLQPEHAAGWILLAVAIATGFWLTKAAGRRQLRRLVRVKK